MRYGSSDERFLPPYGDGYGVHLVLLAISLKLILIGVVKWAGWVTSWGQNKFFFFFLKRSGSVSGCGVYLKIWNEVPPLFLRVLLTRVHYMVQVPVNGLGPRNLARLVVEMWMICVPNCKKGILSWQKCMALLCLHSNK